MEAFVKTHKYLVEHVQSPVKRELMQEIDWSHRLIGIKGSRGVGKTTFLLEYAKENFGTDERCLYINLNHLYFTDRTLVDFAQEFCARGGEVLIIDQVFKYNHWSRELRECYFRFPQLKIIFSGSSVMRLHSAGEGLRDIVHSYNLRGFSFREFLNLKTSAAIRSYTLEELLSNHKEIATEICSKVDPFHYLGNYLHHGFYPFFLEKRNFSENLIKTMNMMMEVDILFIKQIELSYLPKVRKLLYHLALSAPAAPNVSQLAKEINTSRATVVNYINYLKDARLINTLYNVGDDISKKPAMVYMHNTNLMYPINPRQINDQALRETFFYNQLHKGNKVNKGSKAAQFLINEQHHFVIGGGTDTFRPQTDHYYAVGDRPIGEGNIIPLWLFGLLY